MAHNGTCVAPVVPLGAVDAGVEVDVVGGLVVEVGDGCGGVAAVELVEVETAVVSGTAEAPWAHPNRSHWP